MFQRFTFSRKAESFFKTYRSWFPRPPATISGETSFVCPGAPIMQSHKFDNYAVKQFFIGALYFACADVSAARSLSHTLFDVPTRHSQFLVVPHAIPTGRGHCGQLFPKPETLLRGEGGGDIQLYP